MTARLFSRWLAASVAVAYACVLAGAHPATAAPPGVPPVELGHAIKADRSPPLRSLRPLPPPAAAAAPAIRHRQQTQPFPTSPLSVDPVQQLQAPTRSAPAALTSWDGISNIDGAVPPDTEGDVGPNDYVQWVNLSFAIWSKTGTLLYGPAAGNTLWSGFGGANDVCANNNQGDPVVVYDRLADRWVFTQFGFTGTGSTGPYYMCMAVSQSGDPTGSYYRYEFQVNSSSGDFPDYPKLGVWPDGYYLSTNNFNGNSFAGAGAYVFDRTKMLTGDASAGFVSFQLGTQYEGLLPASVSGPTPPPAGSPDYFGSVDTSSMSGTGSTFQIWKLHADFTTPANSTFTGPTSITVAPYTWWFCGQPSPTGCIPQPGTHRTLDPLADRLMFRLQYRNFGDHETLIASHTVNVGSSGADRAGERWYEIRSPGSSPVIAQQGTFAPADLINRWMGSAAMDGNGDIALGYSASAARSTFPSVFYTGRLAGDPAGTMTLGEGSLATGAGSQTGISRWGDYSAMSVDPSDDKTFWYTQEYYSTSSSSGWKTRIGSFRIAGGPTVTMTAPANGSFTNNTTPTFSGTAGTAAGDSQVTVNVYSGTSAVGTPVQSRSAAVAGDGSWSVAATTLAPGTYTARAQQSDSGADVGYSSANTFTVDTTPPPVTLTTPANGTFTNSTTPTFSGAAGADAGDSTMVTVKVYSGTGIGGTPVQTRTATASAGSWSVAATTLAPGTYTAQAQQSDAAGNTGTSSANTFTVDTAAPTVTLTSPANGSLTNSATPTLSGTASIGGDESTTVTVKIYAGSGVGGTLVQARTATVGSGSWSVAASPALADGTYTAQAQQSDAAGNTGVSSASTFTVDTTPPAVTLTSPANGTFTNNAAPTFSGAAGTASGDSSTITVRIYTGTGTAGTLVQTRTATAGAGTWSVAVAPALADGTYTAQAQQSDAAGNSGLSSASSFTVDTTSPTVTLANPANGSLTNSATPMLSGTASTGGDESATVTVKIYSGSVVGGTPVQTRAATASAGSWSVAVSPALADGTYTAQAQQSDAAGNTGVSSANTFTVDTTPPAVTLTSPANGTFTNSTTPTFSGAGGTAAGDSSTITVKVYAGTGTGGALVQTQAATVSAGTWSVASSPALADGTYTARAQQSDTAGNTGSSAANTFTIDTTLPTVTLTSPVNGAVTNNATPTFSGTASTGGDESSTVTVRVYAGTGTGGAAVQTLTTTQSGGSWSVAASPALADGTYTARAQQSDAAGNTGLSGANTFTVLADESPTAAFTETTAAPVAGQPVSFDGSASNDPDGAIASWSWDFGDGSALTTLAQPIVTHTYAAAGAYNVTLTVLDASGNSGSAGQTVNVAAPAGSAQSQQPGSNPPPTHTSPLIAYLQVPKQRLATALAQGIRLRLGASAAARATLRVTATGSAALRLSRSAASRRAAKQVVIKSMQVSLPGPGTVPEVVKLSRRATRSLRGAVRVPLTFQLFVVDRSGRSTTLTTRVVLRA